MAKPTLYVVHHADGSGPMSIPLPLDEAREFAGECNLPYKIEPNEVPQSRSQSVVEFYMEQADASDLFSPEGMMEFESFLMSMPG